MKLKRFFTILFAMNLCTMMLLGCGIVYPDLSTPSDTNNKDNVPAITEVEPEEQPETEMTNPMVPVTNDDEFEAQLGITIDTSMLPSKVNMFIISGELAHVTFTVQSETGSGMECILRGTKNDESAANPVELIAGIYGADLNDVNEITITTDSGDILLNNVHSNGDDYYDVTYWDYNGIHFTLTVLGELEKNKTAELYQSVLKAIGISDVNLEGKTIEPLKYDIDASNITDGQFAADIKNIERVDDVLKADFTLYTMDLYDMVDISNLTTWDTIVISGEELEVKNIEIGNPVDFQDGEGPRNVVIINGGVEEGGAEFIAYEGGTYRFFGFDDHATYTEQCSVNLEISEDAVLTDTSDLEYPDGITFNVEQFEALKDKATDPGFRYLSTTVRIESGKVVEMNRKFIP